MHLYVSFYFDSFPMIPVLSHKHITFHTIAQYIKWVLHIASFTPLPTHVFSHLSKFLALKH